MTGSRFAFRVPFVAACLSFVVGCAASPRRELPPSSAPTPTSSTPVEAEPLQSGPAIDEEAPAPLEPGASIVERPVVRIDRADPAPADAGAIASLGSRAALVDAVARRRRERLDAYSLEERAELRALHRDLVSGRTRRAATSATMSSTSVHSYAPSTPSTTRPSPPSPVSLTNDQVAGVVEGDIVGTDGRTLILLRRGELIRVSLAGPTPTVVGRHRLPNEREADDVWYDELLVDRDVVVVLGYDYRIDASAILRFSLRADGSIVPLETSYVRSSDYYSADDYATRLVDGNLLVYVPVPLFSDDLYDTRFRGLSVKIGSAGSWSDPMDYARLVQLGEPTSDPVLHAMMRCDLHRPRLTCSAGGVIASASRAKYVSRTATYLWTETTGDVRTRMRAIVRLPFDERRAIGVVRVKGAVVDSFAFDERDERLRVLLRADARGSGMWYADQSAGSVGMVDIGLDEFDGARVRVLPESAYVTLVPELEPGRFEERWIDGRVVFGAEPGGRNLERPRTTYVHRPADGRLFEVRFRHAPGRIEPIGSDALIVGKVEGSLAFVVLDLGTDVPRIRAKLLLGGLAEADRRSHGFFFHDEGGGRGTFGLASRRAAGRGGLDGADVSFVAVRPDSMTALGSVAASSGVDRRCTASCFDWYGNTRALFYQDRVFALMGYELVEVTLGADGFTEQARLDFGP